MNKQIKREVVDELVDSFSKFDCFYVVDTTGVSANSSCIFRRKCNEKGVLFKVCKNTLVLKAMERVKYDSNVLNTFSAYALKNMSGLMFVNENAGYPAKIVNDFNTGDHGKAVLVKCAYVMGDVYVGEERLKSLSNLKSKNEVIGDIISALRSGICSVLSGLLNRSEVK